MKKLLILLILILIFNPKYNYAQDGNGAGAVAASILAIGIIASMDNAQEQLELGATEWVLKNTNMTQFNIETILMEGSKVSDVSRSSFVPFKLYEYEIIDLPDGAYEFNIVSRHVLMMYAFPGFITDSGIDFSKVRYELINKSTWFKRMKGYLMAASNASSQTIDLVLENGTILNKGATSNPKRSGGSFDKSGKSSGRPYGNNYDGEDLIIRFYKLDGDSYLVSEYSDENKYLYNEKALGIFHKETERLFKVKPVSVRRITEFLRRPIKARINLRR
jgi:hypothetical protein